MKAAAKMDASNTTAAVDVVELNNAAILKMRQNKMEEAMLYFQVAIDSLPIAYESICEEIGHDTSRPVTEATSRGKVGVVCSIEAMQDLEEATYSGEVSAVPSHNILQFFSRAFTFLNADCMDFSLAENKSSLTSILLFNLGLAHHIKAIQKGNLGGIMGALRFYRLSHSALEHVKDNVNIEVHIVILLGLVNNMGHIHATLCNHEQISRCISWLQQAIQSRQSKALSHADFDFFAQLRLIPLEHGKFAPSA
jgi:hypothetical protein